MTKAVRTDLPGAVDESSPLVASDDDQAPVLEVLQCWVPSAGGHG